MLIFNTLQIQTNKYKRNFPLVIIYYSYTRRLLFRDSLVFISCFIILIVVDKISLRYRSFNVNI